MCNSCRLYEKHLTETAIYRFHIWWEALSWFPFQYVYKCKWIFSLRCYMNRWAEGGSFKQRRRWGHRYTTGLIYGRCNVTMIIILHSAQKERGEEGRGKLGSGMVALTCCIWSGCSSWICIPLKLLLSSRRSMIIFKCTENPKRNLSCEC